MAPGDDGGPDGSAADDDARRTAFGTLVDASRYDQLRPEYPRAAVSWLLGSPPGPLRVLDLAAGTGKVTRALTALGHDVVAVDPSEPMLSALRASLAGTAAGGGRVEALTGSAEEVPLPDGSVDAVVVGQAWHWLRPAAALAEVQRVLRPGGVLGLAWNVEDLADPWARRLERLLAGAGERAAAVADPQWWPRVPAPGAVRERTSFSVRHRLPGVPDVVDLASTYSSVAVSDHRRALLAQVRTLAAAAAAPDGSVVVPMVCHCFRYRLT